MRLSYSGQFKSHERANLLSVHLCKHILYATTRGACMRERLFCANATMSLITLAARIIVHIQTGASMFQVYVNIFNILPHSKYEPAHAHIISSSNKRCNKGML